MIDILTSGLHTVGSYAEMELTLDAVEVAAELAAQGLGRGAIAWELMKLMPDLPDHAVSFAEQCGIWFSGAS